MNQIPSEGEYCGECPCLSWDKCDENRCGYYPDSSQYTEEFYDEGKRLPICLKNLPQIVEEGEKS